jgi:hypothetical protein
MGPNTEPVRTLPTAGTKGGIVESKIYVRGLNVLLLSIGVTSVALAQTSWWRTYGGTSYDCGNSVQQTSDGGYIIAGCTVSFGAGHGDVYLIKTNASGDTLWTRTYGGTGYDDSWSVQQTSDGGYIIAGHTDSFGAGGNDVYLIRTDAAGDTLWTRTYGGTSYDEGYSVRQTADGGYIIAGHTESFGAGNEDVYLIKTNASGDTTWTRTYGGTCFEQGRSVQQTSDGGYIIAGHTSSLGVGNDVYLVRTDASGDTLWTRTYGGESDDQGNSVQQTADGGYIIAAHTWSAGAGSSDVYLIKTNASGDTLWTRTYGGESDDCGCSVQQTADGGYIVAAYTRSLGAGQCDAYLIKTDANGDTSWTKTWGGTSDDFGYSVRQTADGGYIIAGRTDSFGAGRGDVYLIKTDSLGNVGVAEERQTPRAVRRELAGSIVRSLPPGAFAFDATGRRVAHPRPGICFLRNSATAAPRKVLLVE